MKKALRFVFLGAIGLFTIYVVVPVFFIFAFGHVKNLSDIDINKHSPLINKSAISKIDSFSYGRYSSKDEYRVFKYDNQKYSIIIWKFFDIKADILDGFTFEQYSGYPASEFSATEWEVLNIGYKPLKITCSFFYDFEGLRLKLGDFSTIQERFQTSKYKGFIGTVDKMCIVNKNGEAEILFDYFGKPFTTLFLVYKHGSELYFVLVTPTDGKQLPITKDMINIFNLD
jgi:hypothetical protein